MLKKYFTAILCLLAATSFIYSQTDKKALKEARKQERAALEKVLDAYTACKFDDGLRISKIDRIQKDKVKYLARQTVKGVTDKSVTAGKSEERIFLAENGDLHEGVSRTDSYRVMLDYNQPDYFANLRIDRSIPEGFSEDKDILRRWLDLLSSERTDSETRAAQEFDFNGFQIYSTNRRTSLDFDENGVALFFDDANKIYVTVYFLNQRPPFRNYQTIEEWKVLRDRFLDTYTGCVRANLKKLEAASK
jgi:hypothetical protein